MLISQERKQPFGMCKPLLWSCRWREGVRSRGSGSRYTEYVVYTRLSHRQTSRAYRRIIVMQQHQCSTRTFNPFADVRTEFRRAGSPSPAGRAWCGFACSASRRPASFRAFVRWPAVRVGQNQTRSNIASMSIEIPTV